MCSFASQRWNFNFLPPRFWHAKVPKHALSLISTPNSREKDETTSYQNGSKWIRLSNICWLTFPDTVALKNTETIQRVATTTTHRGLKREWKGVREIVWVFIKSKWSNLNLFFIIQTYRWKGDRNRQAKHYSYPFPPLQTQRLRWRKLVRHCNCRNQCRDHLSCRLHCRQQKYNWQRMH